MTSPVITVIFSSYNGAKRLPRTLSSLVAQDFPAESWELIAVDNNSSDNTPQVLEGFLDTLPMTVISQPTPGKSRALNAALSIARGSLIVFTDDDIRADPHWLSALAQCAAEQADCGVFGGRIVPEWETPPGKDPFLAWIPMGSTFAIIDETQSGPCEPTKIWGPNTMIRRALLGSDVRYREDIGPLPGGLFAMGEDQEIIMRLAKRGAKAYRCADAIIHHWIPSASVTETWVLKRAERLGHGIPALFPERVPAGPRIDDVPLKTWLESAYWAVRAALLYPLSTSRLRFWAIWRCNYMRGLRSGIRRYASAR
ncbi:glycosyltransferase family 2 protein [Rhizobium acaciae]|uniref:glycosyltransferase n=1 Tax=Rhizobium acaciae TaxID=2989736 RepID=UPI003F943673